MILNPGKTEFTDAEHAALRQEVERIKTFESLSEAEIARQTELAASVLNSYLKAKYTGRNDPVAVTLNRWLDARRKAKEISGRLPIIPNFQPLGVSGPIINRLHYARALGRLITITGIPGSGKTATAQQYCADTPRAWLATIDETTNGVQTMLQELLVAMGEGDKVGSPRQLARMVMNKASEADGLIIVDEVQHLSDKSLDTLRAINDRCRIGIVLIGNEELTRRVGPTGAKLAFAQVTSRVAQRHCILSVDPADAAALAQAWADANSEVITRMDIEFLVSIALRAGGLRNIEMTFEGALLAARGAGEPLTLEHLHGAWASVTDLHRAA